MNITAALLHSFASPLSIETVQLEEPRPDEILVRIVSSGICHTDLSAMNPAGPPLRPVALPMVYGHEGAGVVESVGSAVTSLTPGDHVVLSFDFCGKCDRCVAGLPNYCRQFVLRNFSGGRADGSSAITNDAGRVSGHYFCQSSFATHAIARESSAVKVRKDVPLELLGPLGCGVQTGAGTVIECFKARPGSSIAVFGTGSVGLSAILGAAAAGCTTIIGVDIQESRLAAARSMGATHTLNGADPNLVNHIREIVRYGVNFAFDTTGIPSIVEAALGGLDELGVLGMVGGIKGGQLNFASSLLGRGRSMRTIIEGDAIPALFIPTMIDLYAQGRFPFDKMVTYFPFDQINEACRASETGEAIKPVLRYS